MNTKSSLKAIFVSLYSKGGASDCCKFSDKTSIFVGFVFWVFSLSRQVAKAPKTSVSTLADIWGLSYKYLLIVILVQGRAFSLNKKLTQGKGCACESFLPDSTGMFHAGDTWSPWIKRLQWGFHKW